MTDETSVTADEHVAGSSAISAELPSDGRVTLPQLLAYAEKNAAPVLLAQGELALGEAEVIAADQRQPFNPSLQLGLGGRRQAGGTGLDAQVAIEQQLEIAGQREKRREAARQFHEQTAMGLDAAAWAVHAQVHWAFQRALLAREHLSLAEERVALSAELRQAAQRRIDVGEEASVLLEVAQAEFALAENTRASAAAEVEISELGLAQASGWQGARSLQPVGDLGMPQTTEGGVELRDDARKSSPTLRQLDAATRVAEADLQAARREAWPSPTVGVSYAHEGSTTTAGNNSPASDILMGTLQIPIPAFARNQGPVARRHADVQVARARQRAVSIQFDSVVAAAVARMDAAARRSRGLEEGVVTGFERSSTALQRAYEVGELGYLEVAQALERLWNAREQALAARSDYYDAFADLERLVGPLEEDSR